MATWLPDEMKLKDMMSQDDEILLTLTLTQIFLLFLLASGGGILLADFVWVNSIVSYSSEKHYSIFTVFQFEGHCIPTRYLAKMRHKFIL